MHRDFNCGELRIDHVGQEVLLSGWVAHNRDMGGMTFIDLRDRYGKTQLVFNMETDAKICESARKIGREFVIKVRGKVEERSAKNSKIPTGDIEIAVSSLEILNPSKTPPFTIEDETDGGEELRMQYRYLDIRRNPVKEALMLRHKLFQEINKYMDAQDFISVETPVLLKSTPEGARDFVVPSRLNQGEFYALPQSPQTFKQLLMVAGMDKYYQIVKCFRDEDLRADRQPEFTQIDCEMSFVEKEDVLSTFEGLVQHVYKVILDKDITEFPRMSYADAMKNYGSDKPDIRFDMKIQNINEQMQNKGFNVFDQAETVAAIVAPGCGDYSRKQTDKLIEWVKRPQIGAKGLVYIRWGTDGEIKSSIDKFYTPEQLQATLESCGAKTGDLMLVMAGPTAETLIQIGELRLHMGSELGLRDPNNVKALWVVDFPLFDWDEESQRYHALHHPFTSPIEAHMDKMDDPANIISDAYDMVINGVELGGGSIRIHNRDLQSKVFEILGFTQEEAESQFGFLMGAFEYGAPPHGGIAFGFDRMCALMGGHETIRDYIAFPKNNAGRDVMLDAPSSISDEQLKELGIDVNKQESDS